MNRKELLHCAYDLICAIEKNAGFPKLLDLSAGTGMTHIGYAQWKSEARESLAENSKAGTGCQQCLVLPEVAFRKIRRGGECRLPGDKNPLRWWKRDTGGFASWWCHEAMRHSFQVGMDTMVIPKTPDDLTRQNITPIAKANPPIVTASSQEFAPDWKRSVHGPVPPWTFVIRGFAKEDLWRQVRLRFPAQV